MAEIKSIIFDCKVITPMFLGNALKMEAELRPTAIKAGIMYWWRARNKFSDPKIMKSISDILFGSGGEAASRSALQIQIKDAHISQSSSPFETKIITDIKTKTNPNGTQWTKERPNIDLIKYIAYGTYKKNEFRNYIDINSTFKIILRLDTLVINQKVNKFKETNKEFEYPQSEVIQDVIESLFSLSLIGGIGSKSRNGFGRFAIVARSDNQKLYSINEILENNNTEVINKFTSFSKEQLLLKTKPDRIPLTTWLSEILKLAEAYKKAKSESEPERTYNIRQYIAQPIRHNNFLERHAKTYFMTIVLENHKLQGYMVFLKYQFLSDNNLTKKDSKIAKFTPTELTSHYKNYENANNSFISSLSKYLDKIPI